MLFRLYMHVLKKIGNPIQWNSSHSKISAGMDSRLEFGTPNGFWNSIKELKKFSRPNLTPFYYFFALFLSVSIIT